MIRVIRVPRSTSIIMSKSFAYLALALVTATLLPIHAAPTQPTTVSFFGLNAYLTKRERIGTDNVGRLADAALATGVRWTREELPWDLIEPRAGVYGGVYDGSLRQVAEKGFAIIGMLATSPAWARDTDCQPTAEAYWCPPSDPAAFARFAGWMTERYDGDGTLDAAGSPRIAAWQIWNEPNDLAVWPNLSAADPDTRQARYGKMLIAAYDAIKAADPTALVLTGGTYIYDGSCAGGICDGLNFFNAGGGVFQVQPAAKQKFDVFAIHPFVPTDRPDAPQIPRIITVEGRVLNTRKWLTNDIGRPSAPIWITEMGWCTDGPGDEFCPGGVAISEDAQANYLVRSLVVAQQNGVQHASWFQLEDAFNSPTREWSNAAILGELRGDTYTRKPAYTALSVLARSIGSATPNGPGPVNAHTFDMTQPFAASGDAVYDYRYTAGAFTIDVIWKPSGSQALTFPVDANRRITLVDRDGGALPAIVSNNAIAVVATERPVYVVQETVTLNLANKVYMPFVHR